MDETNFTTSHISYDNPYADTMNMKFVRKLPIPRDVKQEYPVPDDLRAVRSKNVQAIRDVLDSAASCIVTQPEQLPGMLQALKAPPKMVVTDSQAFGTVKDMVPDAIPLTSFSILFARFKGILDTAVAGVGSIAKLRDGDTVLISEGCTHHRQCEDIGTVKIPRWLGEMSGKALNFEFTSGAEFPEELGRYALIVHCGGCMLNEREMRYRRKCAEDQGVPFTNYGTLIAHRNGILKRSLAIFPEIAAKL